MKKINLTLITIIGLSSFSYAGGDISPITVYEIEDSILADVAVEPIEEVIEAPLMVEQPILTPTITTPKAIAAPATLPVPISTPTVVPVLAKAIVPSTLAKSAFFVGLGAVLASYDSNCNCPGNKSGTDKTAGFIAKVGYNINDYMSVEARTIKTMFKENGGKIEHLGLFLKPSYPLGDLSLYALAGYAKTETKGYLRKTDVKGLAGGLGMDYSLGNNISIFLDYERLFYESGSPDLDTINFGTGYRF